MGVKIKIEQFKSGATNKPVSIPSTYERLKQHPAGPEQVTSSMIEGTIEAVGIMASIPVLGGLIDVVRASDSFESGLLALIKKTKGHEFMLIVSISIPTIIGGTLCGIEEEAVAFYPILTPIFIALGYDSIVSVDTIFLASSVDNTFSTINPFSVAIASNAAGTTFTDNLYWRVGTCIVGVISVISYLYWYCKKIKKDPEASYSYEDKDAFERQ